jgi:DNA-binding GntR family transcriptional regulator
MQETVPVALIGAERLNEDWSKSLVAVMAKRGHMPVASRAGMRAVHLPRELAHKLPEAKGLDKEPWLEIIETNLDSLGQICLFSKVYLKGDLFTFTFIRTDDN